MKNINKIKKKIEEEQKEKEELKSYRQFEEEMGIFDRIIIVALPIILFILFSLIMFKVIYNYLEK